MELRIARMRKRMTQEELARKTGISRNLISKAENGNISKLNIEKMEKISRVLEISVRELFL
mgnify:CR=1 FL=1